jgi:CRISPR/Cas system-associated endonuclease Cas3-HD
VTCWAFYPKFGEPGRVPEEFLRHSVGVVEYMFNNLAHVTTPVIRKASRMLGVSEDLVSDAVLLSGLLHDLGKTCVCYQEKPWRGFSNHWLLSASIMFNIITNPKYPFFNVDKDKPVTLTSLFVLPILLHHYAQTDLLSRVWSTNVGRVQVHNDCIVVLKSLVDYGLARVRSPIGGGILSDLLTDLGDNALTTQPMPGWVRNLVTSNLIDARRLVTMVIAGLLNEADGTVAGRNRNRGW